MKDVEVAFMGDSFTFGHGVHVQDRYTNVYASHFPGRKVVSLSYPNGFQPEHYEFFLTKNVELRPKLLFVATYLGNDFQPDVVETRIVRNDKDELVELDLPFRGVFNGAMVNLRSYKYPWMQYVVNTFYSAKIIAAAINRSRYREAIFDSEAMTDRLNTEAVEFGKLDDLVARALHSLMRLDELTKARGGVLNVVIIPQNFYYGAFKHPHIADALAGRFRKS